MRSNATTDVLFRTLRVEHWKIRKSYVRILLSAQSLVIAASLAGCGNQNFSETRQSPTADKTPRLRAVSTATFRPRHHRQPAPTFDDGEISQATPERSTNAAATMIPDKEETTASIRPDASVSLATPADARTVRAMNCRDRMLKEHPTVRFGGHGTAAAQREYFDSCMRRAAGSP